MDLKRVVGAIVLLVGSIGSAAAVAVVESDSIWKTLPFALLVAVAIGCVVFLLVDLIRAAARHIQTRGRRDDQPSEPDVSILRRGVETSRAPFRRVDPGVATRHAALEKIRAENVTRSWYLSRRDQLQQLLDEGEEMRQRTPVNALIVRARGQTPLTREEFQAWIKKVEVVLANEPRLLARFRIDPPVPANFLVFVMDEMTRELEHRLTQLEAIIRDT